MTPSSLTIKLDFNETEEIPIGTQVILRFNFSSFEPIWNNDKEYTFDIEPKLIEKTIMEIIEEPSVDAVSIGTTLAMLILTSIMTGALSQLWGLINGLQLIVHLPLIA